MISKILSRLRSSSEPTQHVQGWDKGSAGGMAAWAQGFIAGMASCFCYKANRSSDSSVWRVQSARCSREACSYLKPSCSAYSRLMAGQVLSHSEWMSHDVLFRRRHACAYWTVSLPVPCDRCYQSQQIT